MTIFPGSCLFISRFPGIIIGTRKWEVFCMALLNYYGSCLVLHNVRKYRQDQSTI